MWVFNDGKRSSVTELAREIVDAEGDISAPQRRQGS